jgi:hypothetical protein
LRRYKSAPPALQIFLRLPKNGLVMVLRPDSTKASYFASARRNGGCEHRQPSSPAWLYSGYASFRPAGRDSGFAPGARFVSRSRLRGIHAARWVTSLARARKDDSKRTVRVDLCGRCGRLTRASGPSRSRRPERCSPRDCRTLAFLSASHPALRRIDAELK